MLWMLAACNPTPTAPTPVGTPEPTTGERTELTTRDGVALVADTWSAEAGASAVVLLHMTPAGGWNRTDWPADFVASLADRGWWVVALDRRGAGESGGVAEDAFVGEGGRYDVEATTLWLEQQGAGDIAVLGASNGSTSALDYALWAGEAGAPEPVALGFMTGGSYTENQNAVADLTLPAVFTYSTDERDWSVQQQADAPASWVFLEYPEGAHGTHMFAAEPTVADDLITFLEGVL